MKMNLETVGAVERERERERGYLKNKKLTLICSGNPLSVYAKIKRNKKVICKYSFIHSG